MVTRAEHQAKELVSRIEELGGKASAIPLIQVIRPNDTEQLDRALQNIEGYDWIIFTSKNGYHFFVKRLQELGMNLSHLSSCKIAAVGSKTAEAIEKSGLHVDLIPQQFTNEGVIEAIQADFKAGMKVLLPRADIAREILPSELRRLGAEVTEAVVYETRSDHSRSAEILSLLEKKEIDVITFMSPSAVKSFSQLIGGQNRSSLLDYVKITCIGPVTAEAAKDLGLKVDGVAERYTIEGLIDLLLEL